VKLKLTYERGHGRPPVDLLVTVDPSASVGALADHLARSDPESPADPAGLYTLTRPDYGRQEIAPHVGLADSGIRPGATIALAQREGRFAGVSPVDAAAVLAVIAGPDEGREFPLAAGTSVIGRGRDCEVRLTDVLVSRHHAKIHVGDTVEIVDMGSSNGLMVGDEPSDRVVLRPGDGVRVGDSLLRVRLLGSLGPRAAPRAVIAFNRPPRIDALYAGVELVAPEPPELPRRPSCPAANVFRSFPSSPR